MNKHITLFVFFVFSVFQANTQTPPISQYLYKFSPLGFIIARNLGLEDKNGNGVIDKGTGEGYEGFIAKYGNADVGFFINGITQGANNGWLDDEQGTVMNAVNKILGMDWNEQKVSEDKAVEMFIER